MEHVLNFGPDKLRELSEVLHYYIALGYTYVDVPWLVTPEIASATAPNPVSPHFLDSCLVGSAEQGFIQSMPHPGRYVSWSPCYREEPVFGEIHKPYFYKVELCVVLQNSKDKGVKEPLLTSPETLALDACRLYKRYLREVTVVETEKYRGVYGYDLESGGIEIGSYGLRTYIYENGHFLKWIYGTGFVQPRVDIIKVREGTKAHESV